MTSSKAEDAFANMMRIPTGGNRRATLRNVLMRHRVACDAGVDHKALHNKDERRRRTMETHAQLALHRGVGAASGMTGAPELLFGDPLPPCNRWGDAVAATLGGTLGPLETYETLGYEARPSLPGGATVGYADRLGPHGLVSTQLRASALPVVSYADVLKDTIDAQFGRMLVDYGQAIYSSVGLERDDASNSGASKDVASHQQDGVRFWPPRALRDDVTADMVASIVQALTASVSANLPKGGGERVRELDLLGTANVDMYWRMCNAQLERADLAPDVLKDFRALGVCAYARFEHVLRELHRRAALVAVIAHASNRMMLGNALEELAGVLVRCGA